MVVTRVKKNLILAFQIITLIKLCAMKIKLKYNKLGLVWIILALLSYNVLAGESLDFADSIIQEFNSLRAKLAKDNSKANRKKIKKKALDIAFDVVDIDEISRLALGRYYLKLSNSQKAKFKDLFHKIISERIATANLPKNKKVLIEKKIPITLLSDIEKKDRIFKKKAYVVRTQVKKKKTIYEIDIHFFNKKGRFWLYDIHVDQASVLLDFKNQFARIIKKRGVNHLLNQLNGQVKKFKKN